MNDTFALVGELTELLPGNIREARMKAKLTQQELADKIGAPRQTIQRWETSPQNIGAISLEKIAEACGVSVFDLVKPKTT